MATSKTSLIFSVVLAEHLIWNKAPILFFTNSASSNGIRWEPSMSNLVPTRIMGTPGQKCLTSGAHFSLTLPNVTGASTA
ncbi:hypothetical protein WICPIJ_000304 [Wickerhamomyces pijperi]|uniref:Uncharacterized protein n=1 Tax=Wickerhamomyces pijperi TaxID=599730 RepID=A0A9P8QHD6_WICPI|nr:hypothetical protein WICPIJ_000304 [Wickerhamomyces pijperi]